MIQPGSQQPQQEPPKDQQQQLQQLRGRAAAAVAPEAGALGPGPGAGCALSDSGSLEVVSDMFGAEYNSLKQQHDADAATAAAR